jgi:hypothetical protein
MSRMRRSFRVYCGAVAILRRWIFRRDDRFGGRRVRFSCRPIGEEKDNHRQKIQTRRLDRAARSEYCRELFAIEADLLRCLSWPATASTAACSCRHSAPTRDPEVDDRADEGRPRSPEEGRLRMMEAALQVPS